MRSTGVYHCVAGVSLCSRYYLPALFRLDTLLGKITFILNARQIIMKIAKFKYFYACCKDERYMKANRAP